MRGCSSATAATACRRSSRSRARSPPGSGDRPRLSATAHRAAIRSSSRPRRRTRMRALLAGAEADVLVTAHVHLQFERTVLGITSMNAGSVGLQYGGTPAAYWAEIGPEIGLRRTEFDLDEAERRTRKSGIPPPIASFRRSASLLDRGGHRTRRAARGSTERAESRTPDTRSSPCTVLDELAAHEALEARSAQQREAPARVSD